MTRLATLLLLSGVMLVLAGLMFGTAPGSAARLAQEATPVPNLSIGDETCLSCHGQPGQTYPLGDGSELDLYVDPLEHASSIHGSLGYACVQCHADVGEYPHPPFQAANQREATIQLNAVCQRCHFSQYELAQDSVHSRALAAGNRAAAVCSDCHSAHAVQDWVDEQTGETLPAMRIVIPQTCAKCHNAIYQNYLTSVHGSALTQENNPDVPTCIDCHGVHNIEDPTTAAFRLASPQLCAKCHTDPKRMAKYGISTNVLNTYVADFHGTTVTIFEKQSPDAETNKPVCFDCHGVHDISRADDPRKGLQVKANLLATCQKCHPDAAENFPTAWLSHYIPSPDKYPVVYYVDLFYKLFIPTVLGGMAILVVMDASRKLIDLRRLRVAARQPAPAEGQPPSGVEVEAEISPMQALAEAGFEELEPSPEGESQTIEAGEQGQKPGYQPVEPDERSVEPGEQPPESGDLPIPESDQADAEESPAPDSNDQPTGDEHTDDRSDQAAEEDADGK